MRLIPSSVLAASAVALLLSGTAYAQTPQASPDAARPPLMTAPRPDDTPATPPAASPEGLGGDAPSDEMQRAAPSVAAIPHLLTPEEARTLIGKEVRTRDGQPGGSIKDFTLDGSAASIERIVLGGREAAVPAGQHAAHRHRGRGRQQRRLHAADAGPAGGRTRAGTGIHLRRGREDGERPAAVTAQAPPSTARSRSRTSRSPSGQGP
ncbi:PRC-barrel domain-containing protein [Azospirillum brasilense]|uniref:PRC-barrel domain-containing protein n=1 Tax=Azospirillum brasilense TaxID=192 RepID=UPI0018C900B3|nr:PRC-barrel domain-containing protein [Azospirillum brasilense]